MENERIIGVIPNAYIKKGIFKTEYYTLVGTDKRLIAAKFTAKLMQEEAKKRVEEAKEQGKNKFSQFFTNMGTGFTFFKRYLEMDPEEIVKESEGNFTLNPESVKQITLKRGSIYEVSSGVNVNIRFGVGTGEDRNDQNPHRIIVDSDSGKMIFFFKTDIGEAKSILTQIFKNIKY